MKDEPISPQDSQMTRWIDALPDAPLPEGINIDEASRERAAAAAVAALLRQHVPLRQDPPYPDFFNAQVLKKIRDEEALLERGVVASRAGTVAAHALDDGRHRRRLHRRRDFCHQSASSRRSQFGHARAHRVLTGTEYDHSGHDRRRPVSGRRFRGRLAGFSQRPISRWIAHH